MDAEKIDISEAVEQGTRMYQMFQRNFEPLETLPGYLELRLDM